jgi:hypothetical protein
MRVPKREIPHANILDSQLTGKLGPARVFSPSIMQHTFYFTGHYTYIQLTKMSLKYIILVFLATCFGHTGPSSRFDVTYCSVLTFQ